MTMKTAGITALIADVGLW